MSDAIALHLMDVTRPRGERGEASHAAIAITRTVSIMRHRETRPRWCKGKDCRDDGRHAPARMLWLMAASFRLTSSCCMAMHRLVPRVRGLRTYALFAALLIPPFSIAAAVPFVGRVHPPLPDDCQFSEGGVLGESEFYAYERWHCNGRPIVVLQSFVERRGKVAYWKVVDALALPASVPGTEPLEVPSCSSPEAKDFAVFALGRWTQGPDGTYVAQDITQAWRFNLSLGKIEAISTLSVTCTLDRPD